MRTRFLIFFILTILVCQNDYSQKYRTLKEYQEYFIDNYKTIDKIEGIWYVDEKLVVNDDFRLFGPDLVVIIKEGTSFVRYFFKDGNYEPSKKTIEFKLTTDGYQCHKYFDDKYKVIYGKPFYLFNDDNKFSFEISCLEEFKADMKELGGNPNVIRQAFSKYTFSKYFPLESDIKNIDNFKKNETKSGTGFAISPSGLIVTNYHVIDGAKKIVVKCLNFSYDAEVIISDQRNDLAIIKINDPKFKSLGIIPYAFRTKLADVGENIFVLGYPLTGTMGDEVKLTNGIVSSKTGYQGDVSSYQISAPIQPGNSGGPLFDNSGNIIGIVNAKYLNAENVSYAIKINYLQNLIELLNNSPSLSNTNLVISKTLPEKIKTLRNFVYIISVNDFSN